MQKLSLLSQLVDILNMTQREDSKSSERISLPPKYSRKAKVRAGKSPVFFITHFSGILYQNANEIKRT